MRAHLNRKTATAVRLVQWARYQNETIRLGGSTLITGPNTVGKTMILDAMTYCLTGSTRFNSAAQDRDRKVWTYVRGDTASDGPDRFLRSGVVVSYIAIEFFSPDENQYLVVGVGIESVDETQADSRWFVLRDTRLSDIHFARVEAGKLKVTPPRMLLTPAGPLKPSDLMPRDLGVRQVLQALGMRVSDPARYRDKLVKMIAFKPENNIDRFIQESVLAASDARSLSNLREQKQRFDQLRETYRNLQESQQCLEQVTRVIGEYEQKAKRISLDELMLSWQNLQQKQEEKRETELALKQEESRLQALGTEQEKAEKALQNAMEEKQRLSQNPDFLQMTGTLRELEDQAAACREEKRHYEAETAKLLKLRGQLQKQLGFLGEASEDVRVAEALETLLSEKGSAEEKRKAFILLGAEAASMAEALREQKILLSQAIQENDREIGALEGRIKKLDAGRLPLPEETAKTREILQREMRARGQEVSVRTLAELTEEFLDESWRDAVESYLGSRRYHLFLEEPWDREAVSILHAKKIPGSPVVLAGDLPESETKAHSAAALLKIPNAAARRYVNALLNPMTLCENEEELLAHAAGGLTRDGLIAEAWAVRWQETKDTDVCLGARAFELQKERLQARKTALEAERGERYGRRDLVTERLRALESVDWAEERYDFVAPEHAERLARHLFQLEKQAERLRKDPGLTALLDIMEAAEKRVAEARETSRRISGDLRETENSVSAKRGRLGALAAEIFQAQENWETERVRHLELVDGMLAEYEAARKRLGHALVLKEKTVMNRRNELAEVIRQLEDAQLRYLQTSGQDLNRRGTAFIPLYQQEYQNLANVRIEKVRTELNQKTREMEHAILGDFVAEINEKIASARDELDAINRELRELPFGRDTYRFVMRERPDRQVFFRVANRLAEFMNLPDLYLNAAGDSDERLHDIRALLEVILREEDETEYMDYRKYFTYDMQIFSRQGEEETRAELSRKQGSASGGEKQTPYYLILSAALMQYYPRDRCCHRLVFIDEAFAAMSDERISQMVKYFESNDFQVIYAAPPKKLDSISRYITTTVSLVTSGRYTHAIEGSMKEQSDA